MSGGRSTCLWWSPSVATLLKCGPQTSIRWRQRSSVFKGEPNGGFFRPGWTKCHIRKDFSCWTFCPILDRELKDLVFYYKCLFGSTDINVLEHPSFISHGRTEQSNPFNIKTHICRTSSFKASYFNRITKLWNFVCSLKFPGSFSSSQSFKQFVYKTMFTTLVNTYEVGRSCTWTLLMTYPFHRLKWPCQPHPLSCTF